MMNCKKILAVILSFVMVLTTAFVSVNAEEDTIKVINLDSNCFLGGFINSEYHNGAKLSSVVPDGSSADEAYYAIFSSGNSGAYYTLTVKNLTMPTENGLVRVEVVDRDGEPFGGMDLALGEEKSINVRISTANHFIKFYNSDSSSADGGEVLFSLTRCTDPESDDIEYPSYLEKGETREANIVVPEDADVFSFTRFNQEEFKCVIEPEEGSDLTLLAELYIYKDDYRKEQFLTSATVDECTTIIAKNDESVKYETYRLRITSLNGGTGNYTVRFNDVRFYTETSINQYLATSIGGYGEDTGTDYVKFTTAERDAYYDILVHNTGVKTGASADEFLQAELMDESFNLIDKVSIEYDSSDRMIAKLSPDKVYYIKVYNGFAEDSEGGHYAIHLMYDYDEDRGIKEYATKVDLGKITSGKVETSSDEDWYKVTTNDSSKYILMFENKSEEVTIKHENGYYETKNIRAEIINEKGEEIDTVLASGEVKKIRKLDLEPNTTYYIRIYDPVATIADYDFMLAERLILGDTNLDENVKIQDATLIQKFVAKISTIEGNGLVTADVTGDGKVNIKDATAIQKYIAKIETPYNIGGYIY